MDTTAPPTPAAPGAAPKAAREPAPTPGGAGERVVECFFDVVSPASYLAWKRLPAVAAGAGARVAWRPFLLGGAMKAAGNAPPLAVPAKGRWLFRDLAQWARRDGVRFAMNPHFPLSTVTAMRMLVGLQPRSEADFLRLAEALFDAMWADGRNLSDAAVLAEVVAQASLDPADLAALAADPAVKARLAAHTDEAVARGAFGAPTFFVGDEMHFGQDRLDFVREALLARPDVAAGHAASAPAAAG